VPALSLLPVAPHMVLPMKRACPRRPRRPVITAPRLPQRLQPRSRRPSPSRPRSPRRLRSPRRPSRWRCAGSHPASQLYSNREGRPEARPAVGHGGAALPTTFSVAPAQEMEAALSYRATTVPLMSYILGDVPFQPSRPHLEAKLLSFCGGQPTRSGRRRGAAALWSVRCWTRCSPWRRC
jgi:hypothetical protein